MPTILLVDDNEDLRLLLQATLEDENYEMLEAQNGQEALARARESQPSLIVMDWMMPGMSGLDVLRALRKDPETRSIPVILLTARSQEEDRQAAHEAGASAFLAKPFSPLELVHKVESFLGGAGRD